MDTDLISSLYKLLAAARTTLLLGTDSERRMAVREIDQALARTTPFLPADIPHT